MKQEVAKPHSGEQALEMLLLFPFQRASQPEMLRIEKDPYAMKIQLVQLLFEKLIEHLKTFRQPSCFGKEKKKQHQMGIPSLPPALQQMIDKLFFQLRFLEQHSAAQPFTEVGEQGNGMVSDVNQSFSF
ncbi:hypothetical protein ES705_46217 [subsurface metagenome]